MLRRHPVFTLTSLIVAIFFAAEIAARRGPSAPTERLLDRDNPSVSGVAAAQTGSNPSPTPWVIIVTATPSLMPDGLPLVVTGETQPALSETSPPLLETAASPDVLAQSIAPATFLRTPALHTVARGQTLYRIALQYGVTVDAILAANALSDPSRLLVGQQLVIPPADATLAPRTPMLPAPAPDTSAGPSPVFPTPVIVANQSIPAITAVATEGAPTSVNGMPYDQFVILPPAVIQRSREIYALGRSLGRNAHAFSKIGDSTIENPHFLTRFDDGPYNLGAYGYLQGVIDYFGGSFSRQGAAVRRGLHSWSINDPMWTDKRQCQPAESPIACEFRLHNPAFVIICLGANDVGVPELFDRSMRQTIEYAITSGVVPILRTKADRHEGGNNLNNGMIRQIALDYQIPLWDFDMVAGTIPGRGLERDSVHLTVFFAHDWRLPLAFNRGHGVHNLTALIMLDHVMRLVAGDG